MRVLFSIVYRIIRHVWYYRSTAAAAVVLLLLSLSSRKLCTYIRSTTSTFTVTYFTFTYSMYCNPKIYGK